MFAPIEAPRTAIQIEIPAEPFAVFRVLVARKRTTQGLPVTKAETFATAAFLALVLELSIEANLREGALDNGAFIAGMGVYLLSVILVLASVFRSFRLPRNAA